MSTNRTVISVNPVGGKLTVSNTSVQINGPGSVVGLVADATKLEMKCGTAGVKVEASQVQVAFGGAKMTYSPIGIAGDGPTIKWG
jgi:hypothetical protein